MAAANPPRRIFVPARGQYDNIGDILLRRQLLDWLRESGPLHIYIGASPPGYKEGLRLHQSDVTYDSFGTWYLAALQSAARGRASYVFKPGEIQLTIVGMKEHLSMLPVIALVRARGGAVARVGVGSRNFSPVPRLLIRPSIALSNLSLWRDAATAAYLGHGEVMPDLGFAETTSSPDAAAAVQEADERNVLVVSMRSDRPYPSEAWRSAVRETAERQGLQIWTATQVLRDDSRSVRLASDLGANLLGWDGAAHDEQERKLRALYRRSALAVSDRLHVLVAAVTEGAVPAAVLTDSSSKIGRHFAAAGIHDIVVHSAGLPSRDIVGRLENLLERSGPILTQLEQAQDRLRLSADRVGRVLRGDSTMVERPFVAIHVGRGGEIAGGMTQVVNGYLRWDFEWFDTRVIASRNGSSGIRGAGLVAAAAWKLLRLRGRDRSVVVVHLSQKGSFVREGILLLIASARGFATVAQLHGSAFAAFADAQPRLVGLVLRAADLVLTLSSESSAVARRFVSHDSVVLVPNAVSSGTPSTPERLVVFGGGVSARKGVDLLVRGWREWMSRNPGSSWRLAIAGPIIDDDVVPESLDGAEFLGPVTHDALMSLLDRSSIAVLPSRDEAMPLFVLEAMARSNCVVSTRVGGIPSVLGDGAGILVEPDDAAALLDALENAMTDDELREDTARRGLSRFEAEYSASAVYPQVERSWRAALDRSRAGGGQRRSAASSSKRR